MVRGERRPQMGGIAVHIGGGAHVLENEIIVSDEERAVQPPSLGGTRRLHCPERVEERLPLRGAQTADLSAHAAGSCRPGRRLPRCSGTCSCHLFCDRVDGRRGGTAARALARVTLSAHKGPTKFEGCSAEVHVIDNGAPVIDADARGRRVRLDAHRGKAVGARPQEARAERRGGRHQIRLHGMVSEQLPRREAHRAGAAINQCAHQARTRCEVDRNSLQRVAVAEEVRGSGAEGRRSARRGKRSARISIHGLRPEPLVREAHAPVLLLVGTPCSNPNLSRRGVGVPITGHL
eukprot:2207473-Prymnesium_polylepis.1